MPSVDVSDIFWLPCRCIHYLPLCREECYTVHQLTPESSEIMAQRDRDISTALFTLQLLPFACIYIQPFIS